MSTGPRKRDYWRNPRQKDVVRRNIEVAEKIILWRFHWLSGPERSVPGRFFVATLLQKKIVCLNPNRSEETGNASNRSLLRAESAHCADALVREGNAEMKNDPRREQLEQMAEDGDEAAVAELWQVYGVDRRS